MFRNTISNIKTNIVDVRRFKTVIYTEYEKMFPDSERKPYKKLEESYNKGILDFIEIQADDKFVGFAIVDHIPGNPYLLLDYFAILPDYQSRGYGGASLKLLSQMYAGYAGIFIEVEKVGAGFSEEDNRARLRRVKFYAGCGCINLNLDLKLFGVIFSAYILPCAKSSFESNAVVRYMMKMYTAIL